MKDGLIRGVIAAFALNLGVASLVASAAVAAPAVATTPTPQLNTVTPARGATAGGQPVALRGANLSGASAVYFGSRPATDVHVVSATRLTAVTPRGVVGGAEVVVHTAQGDSPTAPAFTYVAPAATATSAEVGPLPGSGQRNDEPDGVDCPVVGWCAAVDQNGDGLYLQILSGGMWTARQAPLPADHRSGGDPGDLLTGISCPAVRQCVAVGSYRTQDGESRGIAVTLTGSSLTSVGVGDSGDHNDSTYLQSVSCGSITYCAAGASFQNPSGSSVGVYALGASGWRPGPAGGLVQPPWQVSCAPAICIAFGPSATGQQTALRTGDDWTLDSIALQAPDGTTVPLSAVDCYAADSCAAIGTYSTAPGATTAVAGRYQHGSWTTHTVPGSPTTGDKTFDRISCSAAGRCVATGATHAAYLTATAKTVDLPGPAGSIGFLSCGASGSCAVGGSYSATPQRQWLDLLSNGVWTSIAIALPDGVSGASGMFGLSCAGTAFCIAQGAAFDVGSDHSRIDLLTSVSAAPPAVAVSNQVVPSDAAADPQELLQHSACWLSTCVAVGEYGQSDAGGGGGGAAIVTRTPSSTTALAAPLPAGAATKPYPYLDDVACRSTGQCVATGVYTAANGDYDGLIETRSATGWRPARVAQPAGNTFLDLNHVACGSACVATAELDSAGGIYSDAAGSWQRETISAPAGDGLMAAQGIACPATGACVGYGLSTNGHEVLLYPSGAATWQAVYFPVPAGVTQSQLGIDSISCSTSANCVAMGHYSSGSGRVVVVVENIDHGVVSALRIPFPSYLAGTPVDGASVPALSCPADGSCVAAVNWSAGSAASGVYLLRRLAGAWSTRPAPLPADAQGTAARLSSAACPTATRCVLAGGYATATRSQTPLVVSLASGAWTALGPALPAGTATSTVGAFFDVRCSDAACLAIGAWTHYDRDGYPDDEGSWLGSLRV